MSETPAEPDTPERSGPTDETPTDKELKPEDAATSDSGDSSAPAGSPPTDEELELARKDAIKANAGGNLAKKQERKIAANSTR